MDRKQNTGIALVAVLWVVVMLSVIAGSFSLSMRTDILLSNHVLHRAKAAALMDAAISRTIVELSKSPETQIWSHDGSPQVWRFGNAEFLIAIQDAQGLLDLNNGKKDTFKALMVQLDIPESDAAAITDAIIDWKDTNKFSQLNGAEDSDYDAAGLPYRSKDAPFDTEEELRLVFGVKHEYYEKLAPFVTVHSRSEAINTQLAPGAILLALPDFDQQQVDEILQRRKEKQAGVVEDSFGGGLQSQGNSGQAYHIRIQVQFQNGLTYTNEIVLTQGGFSDIPFSIIAWKPGFRFPSPEETTDSAES